MNLTTLCMSNTNCLIRERNALEPVRCRARRQLLIGSYSDNENGMGINVHRWQKHV